MRRYEDVMSDIKEYVASCGELTPELVALNDVVNWLDKEEDDYHLNRLGQSKWNYELRRIHETLCGECCSACESPSFDLDPDLALCPMCRDAMF